MTRISPSRATFLLLLVGAPVLALTGCRNQPPSAAPAEKLAPPREVRVVAALEERVPRIVVATGTLAAEEQIVLGMKVAGRISEITVDLGSRVEKGKVIARLDPTDFRHRVEQAEAALHQSRARLGLPAEGTDTVDPEQTALVRQARAVLDEARLTRDRMARLLEQQLIARAQLDAAVAQLQVAEGRYQDALEEVRNRQAIIAQRRSELASARQQLADTMLASPVDGAVSQRQASVGEYLNPGAPIVTIVRIHPLRLRLPVPERDAAAVHVGQPVRVAVEGQAAPAPGRVARLSPSIQEQNRTLMVEAEVPNERGILRPGAFARAEIVTAADQPMVIVPASALVSFAGVEKVLVVKDGKTAERRVQTGRRAGERTEIAAGLARGELVVIQPGNLTGGQSVTVVR